MILNNCTNIYSCYFNENEYDLFLKSYKPKESVSFEHLKLSEKIKHSYILPNNNYFEFANNLKEETLNTTVNNNFLKEHIGFLATKENLMPQIRFYKCIYITV